MVDAPFSIEIDPARRFVDVAVHGLWGPETVALFAAELRRKLRVLHAHGCPPGEHLVLVDITAFIVQVQDVATLLAGVGADPLFAARRAALAVAAPLVRLQARRVLPHYAVCGDRAEALRWLFTPADSRAHSA